MRYTLQRILLCIAILCTPFLSSCVDIHEEFWIHEDGSAKAEISIDMARAATLALGGPKGAKRMAEKMLEDEATLIDSYHVEVIEKDKRVELKMHCVVDELMDLEKLRQSIQSQKDLHPSIRKMVGEYNIGLDGLSGVNFSRTVSLGEAVPALRWLPKSKLKDYEIVKVMHFPDAIETHNAHEVTDNGRTLAWKTPLSSAVEAPIIYELIMPVPIPWGWIMTGMAVIIALFALAFVLVRRKLRSKKIA